MEFKNKWVWATHKIAAYYTKKLNSYGIPYIKGDFLNLTEGNKNTPIFYSNEYTPKSFLGRDGDKITEEEFFQLVEKYDPEYQSQDFIYLN